MDPVTATIVAALGALGSEAGKEAVKHGVKDAYDALKGLIRRKWGAESAVAESVAAVEKKPQSQGLAQDLAEEVAKSGAAKDAEVLQALKNLTEALAKATAAKAPSKTVEVKATNVGIANIDNVAGGTFTINLPNPER